MEIKLANLENKHRSLISFVNKTMDLFQSYVEYNQMIVSEFQQLKQLSKVFELELDDAGSEFNAIYNMPINTSNQTIISPENVDTNYENADKEINGDYHQSFENISQQIVDDQWEDEHGEFEEMDDCEDFLDAYNEEDEEFLEETTHFQGDSTITDSSLDNGVMAKNDSAVSKLKRLSECRDENGEYKCVYCDYKTKRGGDFRSHERTHTGERPFKCSECKIDFIQSSHLTRHKKKHHRTTITSVKTEKFSCLQCNFICKSADILKLHENTHIGKRFKCNKCSNSFTNKNNLIVHQRVHTGERPFKCNICDLSFTVISNLRRHQRRKH